MFTAPRMLPPRPRLLVVLSVCPGSSHQPPFKPLPRLRLHLWVELVRRIVEGAAELLRLAGFAVAVGQFLVRRLNAGEVKQPVFSAIDVELRAWHRQRC